MRACLCVRLYVCEYLCVMNCTVFLQGDEGPLGPPGSAGPTVRTPRFAYYSYTSTHTEPFTGGLNETIRLDVLSESSWDEM